MSKKTAQKNSLASFGKGVFKVRPKIRSGKQWKAAAYTPKRNSHHTKLAILVLLCIVLIIIFGKIINIWTTFSHPKSPEFSQISRQYIWEEQFNINLVVKGKDISILSFNPIDKKIIISEIDSDTYVTVPGGFGQWRISSVFDLGQSEKVRKGGALLKQAVTNFLGVPIDGYLVLKDGLEDKGAYEVVGLLRDEPFKVASILSNIETDLSLKELIKLGMGIWDVRFDKIENYSLVDLELLEESNLADGTSILTPDPVRIDNFAKKFSDNVLEKDRAQIAVFNSTNLPGLAQKAARIITNIGGNVIISSNTSLAKEKTALVINPNAILGDEQIEQTALRMGQIFASECSDNLICDIIACQLRFDRSQLPNGSREVQLGWLNTQSSTPTCDITNSEILNSRAAINLILGEDFNSRF